MFKKFNVIIYLFWQEWLRVSRVELERNINLCRELRDFMSKVSACGAPYQQWCTELRQEFPYLVSKIKINILYNIILY